MPTLIRLIITLLFLGGLAYAGMIALISFVEPTPREVTIRIPSAELLNGGQRPLPGTKRAQPEAPAAEPVVPAAEPVASTAEPVVQ